MDGIVATADALAEVVDAVDGRAEVYVDGGIRHGADVVKAIAMGARAVLIGRPVLWGLSVAGEDGVAHVLTTLADQFASAMAFCGARSRGGAHARSGSRLIANLGACAETSRNSADSNLRQRVRRSRPPPGNSSGRSPG